MGDEGEMVISQHELEEAALRGFLAQLADIDKQISRLRARLHGRRVPEPRAERKHRISAEGRARIAAAQHKRWARVRAGK